jgi:hypothetical protein
LYSTLHWGHTEVFVCKLISGITEGDGLKLHTLIVEHKKRSLSQEHSSHTDFNMELKLFLTKTITLSKLLFYYQALGIAKGTSDSSCCQSSFVYHFFKGMCYF